MPEARRRGRRTPAHASKQRGRVGRRSAEADTPTTGPWASDDGPWETWEPSTWDHAGSHPADAGRRHGGTTWVDDDRQGPGTTWVDDERNRSTTWVQDDDEDGGRWAATSPEADPVAGGRGGRQGAGGTVRTFLRDIAPRERVATSGGAQLRLLVLASTPDDTTAVDLASGALVRLRVPWPAGHDPDLSAFDVVEATLADDPERDDLAQPEAATASSLPRQIGTLRGRRVRRMLARLAVAPDGPLLGFPGPASPYWEFRGFRPSVALIHPTRGPQLIRRPGDGSTWVRFGWERDDVWLPVEDARAARALDAARRERLSGKSLATALGYAPHYLLASVSAPRDGHCYKICTAVLPRG